MTTKWNPISEDKLNALVDAAADRIEELMDVLEVSYQVTNRYLRGPCAVHGGDNPIAWNLYPYGDEVRCRWKCHTHNCHNKRDANGKLVYGATIFGFIRGVLESRQSEKVTFRESVDFLCNFLGTNLDAIKVDQNKVSKTRFANQIDSLNKHRKVQSSSVTRAMVRQHLDIPAQPYIDKGFNEAIIDRYDIGVCRTKGKKMFCRVVVPIYDDEYRYMVGCSGRIIYPLCPKCSYYHAESYHCPTTDLERYFGSKWIHSDGFNASNYLFNYWFAKREIDKTKTVYLTESPGNVLRLVQNGVHNIVGTFGTHLTESQQILLESCGAFNVGIIEDNDQASRDSSKIVVEQLKRLFNVRVVPIPFGEFNDVGEMTDDYIKENILQLVR